MVTRRRKKNHGGISPSDRWQTIYCSFALILVVFFVMILSNSIVSGKSVSLVQQQFSHEDASPTPDSPYPSSFQEQENIPVVLNDAAKRLHLDPAVVLKMTSTGIDVVFPEYLLFSEGKSAVKTEIFPYLSVIGDVIAKNGFSLQVRVYDTLSKAKDNMPMGKQMSWVQAAYRATNIMRYFLAYGRLTPDQVTAVGFVSQESLAAESNAANKKRIELHLAVKGNH